MIDKSARSFRSVPLGSLILSILCLSILLLGTPSFVVLAASPPNLDKALAAQQQMVVDRPYDAEVHNDHGNLLVLAGRHEEASDAYRRSIELAPGETLARYNLAVLLQQTGFAKQAVAAFQELLEIDARHARAHYQLGMLFDSRKQRTRALEHYAQAFAYDPGLTFAKNNPHILDNRLATEALLISQSYGDAPSSDVPRLYGEPERIVDLMLAEAEESSEAPDMEPDDEGNGSRSTFGDEEDDEEAEEDEEDDDEDSEERASRALTTEDLDAGSTVGRVRRQPSRRSSAGRDSSRTRQGRGGFPAVRPPSREGSTGDDSNQGRTGRSTRRYRPPTSRLSTGRLELELLPAGSSVQRSAATATR